MPQTVTLTASEVAAGNAGRPCMAGRNVLELADAITWSTGGTLSGVAASVDPRVVADRSAGIATSALTPAAPASWWLVWSYPATGPTIDVDAVAVWSDLPRIAALLADDIIVTLQVADASDFTGAVTVAEWTVEPGDPDRAARFFAAGIRIRAAGAVGRWWRLRMRRESAADWTTAHRPSVSEVWLAKRRQWLYPPQRPYDPDATDAEEDLVTTLGGARVGATAYRGRGLWDLSLRLRQDDLGAEARDVLREWWRDSDYGGPSLWWPRADQPDRVHLVRPSDRGLSLPEVGPALQEASLLLLEQPPFWAPQRATPATILPVPPP